MTATPPITLCEQLGRHWAANSAIPDWAFVDADQTNGNIWACPLAELERREAEAASLTIVPTAPRLPGEGSITIGVEVRASAPSWRRATEILADLLEVLFPSGQAFVFPATAELPSGLIGIPTLASGATAALWRVIEIQPESNIVPVLGGRDDGRSATGQDEARMDLRCRVTPFLYQAP